MVTSFADFKRNSEDLNKKLEETLKNDGKKKTETDERFWYPSRDKDGNGTAVIRFLPAGPHFDLPMAKLTRYAFKNPATGMWYIENSPVTIGKECPAAEAYWQLKKSDDDTDQKLAKIIDRKVETILAVYVISDGVHPENNGTVRLMKAGPMWTNMIKGKMVPEFEDMAKVPVFDLWKGATLRIRIKTEAKEIDGKRKEMPNYQASTWDEPAPLFDDDDKIKEIWEQIPDLGEFVDPKNIKDYDVLKARLDKVLGRVTSKSNRNSEDEEAEAPKQTAAPKEKKTEEPKEARSVAATVSDDDDDGIDMKFFEGLNIDDDEVPF